MQKTREHQLKVLLQEFNEGRSKSYYCITATVMEIRELEEALTQTHEDSQGRGNKEKSRVLHSVLDDIARQRNYYLKLRK